MQEKLPSAVPDGEPLPEGLLWLLLTGDVSRPIANTLLILCVLWVQNKHMASYVIHLFLHESLEPLLPIHCMLSDSHSIYFQELKSSCVISKSAPTTQYASDVIRKI